MASEERIGKHAKHAKAPVKGAHAAVPDEGTEDVQESLDSQESTDSQESLEAQETAVIAPPGESQSAYEQAAAEQFETPEFSDAETTLIDPLETEDAQAAALRSLDLPAVVEVGADDDDEAREDDSAASGDGEPQDDPAFVPAFDMAPSKKPRKVLKGVGIALGVLVGIVAVVYVAGIAAFSNWFLPNTTVGGMDVSLKSSDEVAQMLDDHVANYKLDVSGGTFAYSVDATKLGLVANSRTIVQNMHDDLESWKWPYLLWEGAHDESDHVTLTYLESTVDADVKAALATYNEGAQAPQNATVIYNDQVDAFVVQPEVPGTQYDPALVTKAVDGAIRGLAPTLALTDEHLVKPTVLSTDQRLTKAANDATKMINARLTLSLEGVHGGEVGPDQLHPLVSINENFEAKLDEDALIGWVEELTEGYNTVGTERTYTRPDGKEITVSGGEYGWEVDAEALRDEILEGVRAGATKQIEVPCSMVGEAWNGVGKVDWGNRYVDVDLSEQYVRFYDDNSEIIWESDCITGAPDGRHNTVEGVWYVTGKESPSKLVGYENGKKIYETYVQWWMPFEYNSIGFHDANWQPAFGGSMYANGYGSHGCVNLPVSAAEELYYIIEPNDVVIVHW